MHVDFFYFNVSIEFILIFYKCGFLEQKFADTEVLQKAKIIHFFPKNSDRSM